MAATQAFVHMVLGSVCLQSSAINASVLASLSEQQRRGLYSEACAGPRHQHRQHNGKLVQGDRLLPLVDRTFNTSSLQGRTIRFAVKQMPTEDHLNSRLDPDRWSFHLISMLSDMFGFSIQYVPAPSGTGGVPNAISGDWIGVMGQVIRKEVDVSGSFIAATSPRVNIVSFGETATYSQIGLLIRRPRPVKHDNSLLEPFTLQVWLWIAVSMVVMGPVMWAIIRFRVWLAPCERHLNRTLSLGACIWFVYGGLMKQGSVHNPTADSSRMLFATWWIFITVITAFYTANLTAYMTFSELKIPVESINDLGDTELSWIAPSGDTIQMFVEDSPILMDLKRRGRGSFLTGNEPPGHIIRKTSGGGHVYIDEVVKLNALMMQDYFANNHTCGLYVVPLRDQYLRLALVEPLDGQLLSVFDPLVHWLMLTGIAKKWRQDAEVDAAACSTHQTMQGATLKNEELMVVYYIVIVAYAIAAVLLLVELLMYRLSGQCTVPCLNGVSRDTLSTGFLRKLLKPSGDKVTAWETMPPVGGDEAGLSESSWSAVFLGDRSSPSLRSPPPPTPGRTDQQVLEKMRENIKLVNGRPYMFVEQRGVTRPLAITETNNTVFESIFQHLKERPPTGGSVQEGNVNGVVR